MAVTGDIDGFSRGEVIAGYGRRFLRFMLPIWIFAGGFVIFEPSPYEFAFLGVLAAVFMAGVSIHYRTRGFVPFLFVFVPSSLLAVTQIRFGAMSDALVYTAVTLFLLITSFVVANVVAEAPAAMMRRIFNAYIASALLLSIIGTLAYLGFLPGEDVFLKFGRAKATFKDPNVYGPFLMLPAAAVLQRILIGRMRGFLFNAAILAVLFVGIFVSFSRGAWVHFAVTALLVVLLTFTLEAGARIKVRIAYLSIAGAIGLVVITAGLLSIDSVRELFEVRASVVQDYDSGVFGRFGRQLYALELIRTHPFGIGPLQFRHLRIVEEPHNTYANVFLTYGWLGGAAFVWLIWATLMRAVKSLAIPSPNRILMIPLFATYLPLIGEAAIIDIDHWRHLFLIIGLIWGVAAGYDRVERRPQPNRLR
ncbi:O-antigen ligase family protein [Cucumibacter marinus]|uniref:O-antigen ligase family protein n=1 Tax=Cucumibacter marinus TaxID=1121252 RepID=UPI0004189BBC|nr:O-antigen ligase family protein [Cucumibacter marinus]